MVDDPIYVTINVLDINNNAPYFKESVYTAEIREHSLPGVWYEWMKKRRRLFLIEENN